MESLRSPARLRDDAMSTCALRSGRPRNRPQPRDVLIEAQAEEEVVAGDRIGPWHGPHATDSRTRSAVTAACGRVAGRVAPGRRARRVERAGAALGEAGSTGRPEQSGAPIHCRAGAGAAAAAAAAPEPRPAGLAMERAFAGARPRQGSSATPRSSARRPRGRKRLPRPRSSPGRRRCLGLADEQPRQVIAVHAPHAVARRSSECWSQTSASARTAPPGGARLHEMSSSRVTRPPHRRSSGLARSARAVRVQRPGVRRRIGEPANAVTGRTPATLDDRNASSAAARSAGSQPALGTRQPPTPRAPRQQPQPSHPRAGLDRSRGRV